ncbi:hypothetical protein [Ruminococcus sp.]|uniref:hypothetical protein n=1 Tax=Ruminococcus sp. TaxID=41978 RepID=UPI0025CC9D5B|nr:hypothetical protein [Ruminococcus sp.]
MDNTQFGLHFYREEMFIPQIVSSAFECIIRKVGCERVFFPFAKGDEVISCHNNGVSIDYWNPNVNICKYISEQTGVEPNKEYQSDNVYDLIISDLPFGPVTPSAMHLSIAEKAFGMNTDSYIVLTFAGNITTSSQGRKWIGKLEDKGIYVNAIIDMIPGVYKPITLIESRILFFAKTKSDDIFLAKIRENEDVETVIDNFVSHRNSSKAERLGEWFVRGEFPDFSAYENHNRKKRLEQKLSKSYNGELVRIEELCNKLDAPRKDGFKEECEAAVYIPKLGKTDVVTRIAEFDIKAQNYYRLIVDQDKIIPGFLAFILNTEAGIELRLRAMSGATIPFLNSTNILDIEVPLPLLTFQTEILKLDSELNQIAQESNKLRERLKQTPASYKTIRRDIKNINNRGDKFEQWIELLPYPIATILKRYQVAEDDVHKQEMLLYFFEAYSIFEAAILIGAYGNYSDEENDAMDVDASFFEKASFGSWVRMNRALSKSIRKRLDNKDTMDRILECFCTDDRTVINALCNNDICNILQGASDNRNSWRGHSGITGESIYADHVRILEDDLNRFQDRIQDTYEKIQLIRPLSLKHKDGEFINTVEVLTGSNPIFKKCEFVGEALDESKLYIRMLDTNKVFEIPPFLLMKNSPADIKNACYFYSRLEGANTKYISYHFEGQPEDIEQGDLAYSVIRDVLNNKNSN